MLLVEQHIIKEKDKRFEEIDRSAFASKNLYNLANYYIRQKFFETGKYTSFPEMAKMLKGEDAFKSLPAKVSQWVLKQVDTNWRSFFESNKIYKKNFKAFGGKPKIPHYKDKDGRNVLIYTSQAISRKLLRSGTVKFSGMDVTICTKQVASSIRQVRIVPAKNHYIVEVVYEREIKQADLEKNWIAGIDIGLNNLVALTSNKPAFKPIIVNGRPLKSINQFYNKRKAYLQSLLPKYKYTSRQIEQITTKRNFRIRHYLHVTSRRIVNILIRERISTLVIGKNDGWKNEISLGKRNNQNFVSVPHARFIDMLCYKCELVGIKVVLSEESYTSKCSFLDLEPIQKHEIYLGKRTKRGLFVSATGRKINADVNASLNIIRKVIPNAFSNGIAGLVVAPVRLCL